MALHLTFLRRLEARFGLTRGDVTVALFLAATALAGFVYTRFFESRDQVERRTALAALVERHDSVAAARDRSLSGAFQQLPADSDSVAQSWQPLTEEEVLDEQTSGSSSGAARAQRLTLKDVAPVNINTAPASALELLPGVGEKTAEKIIEFRQSTPFKAVEDIMNVKGIGPKKFAEMKPYITIGSGPKTSRGEPGKPDTAK